MKVSLSHCLLLLKLLFLLPLLIAPAAASSSASTSQPIKILVVGSINADTFLPVPRLPVEGENIVATDEPKVDLPGGKGCTQAVAAAKLLLHHHHGNRVSFVGQFGNDKAAVGLKETLLATHVDISHCGHHKDMASGRGYVFLTGSGQVSAVVTGGSNLEGWARWKRRWEGSSSEEEVNELSDHEVSEILHNVKCVMLQREVPEYVNLVIASEARKRGILVIQDVGGQERPISRQMLELCDYLVPNESELNRLVSSFSERLPDLREDAAEEDTVIAQAEFLQKQGARNILVTRGNKGCILVTETGTICLQQACTLAAKDIVDETGAGDCFRAAFCVALLEGRELQECLAFSSAAGACAVTKQGAVPSTPSRQEVADRCHQEMILNIPRGGTPNDDFPFLFGSRLNSMKDRPDLWSHELKDPSDYVKRQATVDGLTCVDFNYPQHFHTWTSVEARMALKDAGLVAGAVCLRFPPKFAQGAMNHPDVALRREAIDLTKEAAEVAKDLGCNEVVVWSAFDGYDYPFQVDYDEKWSQLVEAFQECCDAFPGIKFSIEYKPTDENTRFFTVPSTGAAILLVNEVDRRNFGLTLDVGHMLMSGENPGQSIAMAGKKLFGIQLNDGYTRLAAEDGLMFGSIHPSMALEVIYQLRKIGFSGHIYFDTFPQRTDPIRECEYNIRRVKQYWKAVEKMSPEEITRVALEHDALGALALVDRALSSFD
jgi:ribokinase